MIVALIVVYAICALLTSITWTASEVPDTALEAGYFFLLGLIFAPLLWLGWGLMKVLDL